MQKYLLVIAAKVAILIAEEILKKNYLEPTRGEDEAGGERRTDS
jgi:acyl CoA:acetate/3-ketoacid CoA transferase alpha subunit